MNAGNFKTYELTINNGAHGELDLSGIVSTEKVVKVNQMADNVRILITPSSSTEFADASDYLLMKESADEFALGTGLDRLSFWNASGSQIKVSIAVLF